MALQKKANHWHYDGISRRLHWLLALLIISMLSLGFYMMSIADDPDSNKYFSWHKSLGLITATLVLIRILWRTTHKPAPLPSSVAKWQAKLAHLMHLMLYAGIIIMPAMGFLGSSYGKNGVAFFGWPLPEWATKNTDLAHLFFNIHGIVAWVLVVLISLHVLAAFKHLIIDKDGVFQRMWQ